jgi:hypothetical protein
MQRRSVLIAVAVALAGTLAVSAVAGATAPAKGKPMSAKQFRKTANNICDQGNSLRSEAASQHFAGLGPDQQPDLPTLTAYIADIQPIVQQEIDSIKALNPPSSLKKKVKNLLKVVQKELAALVADPSIALESDPFADANRLSKKLRLDACAGEATGQGGA